VSKLLIGYARCSTDAQDLTAQQNAFRSRPGFREQSGVDMFTSLLHSSSGVRSPNFETPLGGVGP
jgi:hypothetical protein